MDYFQLFELPVSLQPDRAAVRKKYFELSRRYHPDYFSGSSDEDQQQALDMSSSINKALKIFSSNDETIRYVLTLKGLLEKEEKYALPPQFLMEMMEVNEQMAEAQSERDSDAIAKIRQQIKDIEIEIYEPVQKVIEHYQEDITTEEELLQVKDYYFRKKYLERLQKGLDGML